ncbi:hypothetical protein GCM10010442_50470 [Kitasatospora kifunensis]|uniref:Uncharacterized protein n=1 Tax=Kitasatospora kifunensis TaxID=58351 RepID=A0A7W7VT67_KITKI|nr:hypothetical protein [Kitasatospora kifunensis]
MGAAPRARGDGSVLAASPANVILLTPSQQASSALMRLFMTWGAEAALAAADETGDGTADWLALAPVRLLKSELLP